MTTTTTTIITIIIITNIVVLVIPGALPVAAVARLLDPRELLRRLGARRPVSGVERVGCCQAFVAPPQARAGAAAVAVVVLFFGLAEEHLEVGGGRRVQSLGRV